MYHLQQNTLYLQGGRFCEESVYVNLANYKDLNSIIRLWTNQKLQEVVFEKSATSGVKVILLPFIIVWFYFLTEIRPERVFVNFFLSKALKT